MFRKIPHRALWLAAAASFGLPISSPAQEPRTVDWTAVREQAQSWMAKESPPEVWPFERLPANDSGGHPRKVFAHYFSPFPLSMDNKPAAEDTYTRVHLSPEGSDAKLAGRGGYKPGGGGVLRQRPLPVTPWDSPDWREINLAIEVLRAQAIGLDGFTYDILGARPGSPHLAFLKRLLSVAENVAPGFKIVLMPDMNAELKKMPERLVDIVTEVADAPALFRLDDGRVLIAPYNGAAQPPAYWRQLLGELNKRGIPAAFLPVFVGYEHLAENGKAYGDIAYGMSDWGFRDIAFAKQFDFARSAEQARPYSTVWMMPVAPQDVRAKSLIAWEPENTRCFRYLWDAAIEGGSEYLQLVTWNDYSEASEISPSSGTQFAFYDLTAYYTAWFKSGKAPAIKRDAIYYTHRTQLFPFPQGVTAAKQREPFKQAGKTPFQNNIEMVALLTAPATLEIEQQGNIERREAPAGLAAFQVPIRGEGRPVFRIVREGKPVAEVASQWDIVRGGDVENPIYHGGSSTRPAR